ncbi:hypothetical protein F5Y05DRAFT_129854 [Hypoxylon sp. FL0543]|nr:hypothetical protein F5Y05DRAFT_129854 [Hypoxylon sp. FL0543]
MSKSPSDHGASASQAQQPNGHSASASASAASTEAEMAKAFTDVLRGEQQAAALEASLTHLESRIDALLASMEDDTTSFEARQGGDAGSKEKESEAKK